jgi:hypothetical protein
LSHGTHHVKYESPITNHSRDIAKVKLFADRQKDLPKTICPLSFDTGAKKSCLDYTVLIYGMF